MKLPPTIKKDMEAIRKNMKELPAQTLFLLLKHSELIIKFVNGAEFGTNMMPLIQKSLECGVAKL